MNDGKRFIHHNERKTNKKVSEALAYHVIMERLHQTYPDGVIEINNAKVRLKPGRIYDIEIKWEESEENRGFSGSVDYFFVTEGNGSSNEGDQHF